MIICKNNNNNNKNNKNTNNNNNNNNNNKNWNFQFPQPDYQPRHSPDFRTLFGIMIGPFSSCEIGKTWGLQNEKKPYVKWEKARKPLSNGRKWANYLPRYHVTELISEQVSDFSFGHQKCPFWEWEKATFTAFPHFRKFKLQMPSNIYICLVSPSLSPCQLLNRQPNVGKSRGHQG